MDLLIQVPLRPSIVSQMLTGENFMSQRHPFSKPKTSRVSFQNQRNHGLAGKLNYLTLTPVDITFPVSVNSFMSE